MIAIVDLKEKKKKQFFRGFTFTIKLRGRYRDFPHTPSPYRIHYQHSALNDTYVITDVIIDYDTS